MFSDLAIYSHHVTSHSLLVTPKLSTQKKIKMTASPSSASPSSSSSRRFFGEEWTLLSTRSVEGERYNCAYASLDGKRHFLFGGFDAAHYISSTVVEYNSTSQNWLTHPPLPEARSYSAAIAINDDRLLVVGGHKSSTEKSCVVYDTRSKEWSTDWPLNIGRYSHASVYTHNKKAYVIGGYNEDSIEEIDLSLPSPSWRVLPQRLNKERSGCCAIAHPKNPNYIIVVGGSNSNFHLRCCEMICLDQTQGGQTRRLPPMTTPRARHALVLVENRFIVAMGGVSTGNRYLSSVEYLDLEEEPQEQQQWRPLPSMKTARRNFAAFYSSENHKIVVAGGWDGHRRSPDMEELPVLFRGHVRASRQLRERSRVRIRQLLDETKKHMTGFLESINEREGELIQECDENRRLCNEYIAQVSERQSQARRQASAILSCMQDTRSTRGNPSSVPASDSICTF